MADNACPIIDSHIHLFAASHLSSLNWTADLPADHVLNRGNTVADYKTATSRAPNLKGFVFLETDRKSGPSEAEWTNALDEVAFLARIAEGRPIPNQGHEVADSHLVLGIVPWAPIPAGPDALAQYVDKTLALFSPEKKRLVKGFRYLLQDKPPQTLASTLARVACISSRKHAN
jgi:L-rhamnono-1,4-lactonase